MTVQTCRNLSQRVSMQITSFGGCTAAPLSSPGSQAVTLALFYRWLCVDLPAPVAENTTENIKINLQICCTVTTNSKGINLPSSVAIYVSLVESVKHLFRSRSAERCLVFSVITPGSAATVEPSYLQTGAASSPFDWHPPWPIRISRFHPAARNCQGQCAWQEADRSVPFVWRWIYSCGSSWSRSN